MKPSIYNVTTTNPTTGDTILFNTLYGSTASIDQDHLQLITTILASAVIKDHEKQDSEVLNFLRRGRFIVDDETNELEIVKNRKQRGMKDKNRADVIIMPNMDCNFACPYCYEKHDHKKRMSGETEKRLKSWLKEIIKNHKLILLNWFGGEPLLSHRSIISIGSHVLEICEQNNVSLITNITTNGYALSKQLIDRLIEIKIFSFQITIDGPPRSHNKTRVLLSGKGTFDRILSNVVQLAETSNKIKISLRVNYNHNNIYDIPELLSLLPAHIRPQLRIVFEPIFGNSSQSATQNLPAAEISRIISKYYQLAKTMEFDVVHGGLGVGKLCYCYAEREHQYIVDYNANVFKCSVSQFDPTERVGYIEKNGNFVLEEHQWNRWFAMDFFEKDCELCTFLPLCMGGCRKDRVENKRTGSYCHLIPTNTSNALKSVAFGTFTEFLNNEIENSRNCAINRQS